MPNNKKIYCLLCGGIVEDYDEEDPKICLDCWKCPKCGVGSDNSRGVIIECTNEIFCQACDFVWTTKGFERALIKKKNLITCPTCKGKGTVNAN